MGLYRFAPLELVVCPSFSSVRLFESARQSEQMTHPVFDRCRKIFDDGWEIAKVA
jgi:hypothetical protein